MDFNTISQIHLLNVGGTSGVIISIINALLGIIGLVAVLFIIIGGFRYVAASGNPDQLQGAKNSILYGVIGLGVAILSWAIVNFVITSLTQMK